VRPDEQITELPLLLSVQQVSDLEQAAGSRGLTIGQLIRLLLRTYLLRPGMRQAEFLRSEPPECVAESPQAGR